MGGGGMGGGVQGGRQARTDRIGHRRHLGVLLAEQRSRRLRQRGHHVIEIDPGHAHARAAQCSRNERVAASSSWHGARGQRLGRDKKRKL